MIKKKSHLIYSQIKFVLIILLIPVLTHSQSLQKNDITGVWSGYVKTSAKKITYEVVINDSSGTLVGYSKIIFNKNGIEISAIKSLSIKIEDDNYVLEEMELISDNFDEEAPRKIKQINTLGLRKSNKQMMLTGEFKTKATMGLRSATGDVYLQKAIIPDSSLLFSELKKIGKTENLSFVIKAKQDAIVAAETKIKDSIYRDSIKLVNAKLEEEKAKTETVAIAKPTPPKPTITAKPSPPTTPKPAPTTKVASPAPTVTQSKQTPVIPAATTPAVAVVKPKPDNKIINNGSAADLKKRNIETIQTVYFQSDSLNLTLYDNGEVDGDTVSVVVNGKVIMGKEGLSTKPKTQTLYLTPELGDSIQMVMYAENLGKIPPNSGLLIVQDGKERYEIRFSGDLSKNAAIIFKRKN